MILRCFNQWMKQHDGTCDYMTQGRTMLLLKAEDLSNERNYCAITCLNIYYKILRDTVDKSMK